MGMKSGMNLSWLDRKVKLAFDVTCANPVNRNEAGDIYVDVCGMIDDTREQRPYGEKSFVARAKILLMVIGKLRPHLSGKALSELDGIEGFLLSAVTEKKS